MHKQWGRKTGNKYSITAAGHPVHTPLPDHRLAIYWIQHTTSCIAQSNAPEDGQYCCPKYVELIWIYQ
jgi:hypothetical protein